MTVYYCWYYYTVLLEAYRSGLHVPQVLVDGMNVTVHLLHHLYLTAVCLKVLLLTEVLRKQVVPAADTLTETLQNNYKPISLTIKKI